MGIWDQNSEVYIQAQNKWQWEWERPHNDEI